MLEKIMNCIRERLLKVDWIKLEVEAYKNVQQKKRDDQLFAKFLLINGAVHDTEELVSHKTLATVSNSGIVVDYMDGRMVGQSHVFPLFVDSTNWGVINNSSDINNRGSNHHNNNFPKKCARAGACGTDIGPCEAEQSCS